MQIGLMGLSGFSNSKASEAAKWGETPQIQQKANVTAKNAMTDSYVEQLKEYAKRDAQKGIYMDNEAILTSEK